jgi:CRP-like cAMP-binding protein
MLPNLQFKTDQILFQEGDQSDRVLQVISGEVEILREVDGASIVLGHVRPGEWLGEMGVPPRNFLTGSAATRP